jgi:hypothetical protein
MKDLQIVSGGTFFNSAKKDMEVERINGTKPKSMTSY